MLLSGLFPGTAGTVIWHPEDAVKVVATWVLHCPTVTNPLYYILEYLEHLSWTWIILEDLKGHRLLNDSYKILMNSLDFVKASIDLSTKMISTGRVAGESGSFFGGFSSSVSSFQTKAARCDTLWLCCGCERIRVLWLPLAQTVPWLIQLLLEGNINNNCGRDIIWISLQKICFYHFASCCFYCLPNYWLFLSRFFF